MKSNLLAEIFLHGDSNQNYAVVICTPHKNKLEEIANKVGVENNFEALCKDK